MILSFLLRYAVHENMLSFLDNNMLQVEAFTESELDSMIDYYIERGYLGKECDSRAARQEIHFLTGRNPGDFFKFSNSF